MQSNEPHGRGTPIERPLEDGRFIKTRLPFRSGNETAAQGDTGTDLDRAFRVYLDMLDDLDRDRAGGPLALSPVDRGSRM
jgi:hypothetical protein